MRAGSTHESREDAEVQQSQGMLPEQHGSPPGEVNIRVVYYERLNPHKEHPWLRSKAGTKPCTPQLEHGGRLSQYQPAP